MKKKTIHAQRTTCRRSIIGLQAGFLSLMTSPVMAQFSPQQDAAFSVSIGRPTAELNLLIAGLLAALIFLGMGWISYAAYGRWAEGRLGITDVVSLLLRASALLVIAGIFLR